MTMTDMEEKVAEILQILDDDGDSFARRAETYYRKRPELVSFVEESLRAYKSLADRYDHLSKELQSANRTIVSIFPDQVRYSTVEDDEDGSAPAQSSSSNNLTNLTPKHGIPEAPRTPKKDFRSPSMLLSNKGPPRRLVSTVRPVTTPPSELTKEAALEEIDKLQKEILGLQTEKEFVRSLYERSYNKYWEIEDRITEMQKTVCSLQDEFGVGTVIEDQEARTLMAATALKSCHDTLAKLQEAQEKASEEAKVEYQRVKEAHDEFEALRDEFVSKHANIQDFENQGDNSESTKVEQRNIKKDIATWENETQNVTRLREKFKKQLQADAKSFTVIEMADKIDDLVKKVVTLETAVSSQASLIKRLRSETDELTKTIQSVEEDKQMLINDSVNMSKKLKELEEELRKVKSLQQNVEHQKNSFQTHFTEASCNLEHLSERLPYVKQDEEVENLVLYKEKKSAQEDKPSKASEEHLSDKENDAANNNFIPEIQKTIQRDKDDLCETASNVDIESRDFGAVEGEDQPNWRQMFINGLDDREKILLEEYTLVLRNYKEVRIRLNEMEKRNRESIYDLAFQVRELKNIIVAKDKEINCLQQKLVCPEMHPDEITLTPMTEYKYSPHEGPFPSKEPATKLQDTENSTTKEDIENVGEKQVVDKPHNLSPLEQKLRCDINDLQERNLDFWLRFSTSVNQIQKFQTSIEDLQAELVAIKDNNREEGSSKQSLQSEIRPIFRHLREIRTELSLWLEHNAILQDESRGRDSSLDNIQDEVSRATAEGVSDTEQSSELSGYQAAKFHGEILNMKQENNKIATELQAGLGLVKGMKNEVEKTLAELDQAYGISKNPTLKPSGSRIRVPLRSFLFGVKLKKQKQSIFACVNPMQQQHRDMEGSHNAPI